MGRKGQVQRFIRLNNLIPEIMDMVDEKKIAFNPAVELSYLKPEEQREFLEAMERVIAECCIPRQFRLQVSHFIMDITQGEGGGSDAIED